MTIASLSDLAAGMAVAQRFLVAKAAPAASEAIGVQQSWFERSGTPGAGTLPTTLAGTTFTNASAGAVALVDPNPASLYLGGLAANISVAGELVLHDLLWMGGGAGITDTTTGAQSFTSPTWPARDNAASTNGAGLELWFGCYTTIGGNGAISNTTATYTNSGGTGSRTATLPTVPATLTQNSIIRFTLQGDDVGVRSIQSLTLGTSYVTGAFYLLLMRRIAEVPIAVGATPYVWSWADLGLPLVYPTSYLHFSLVPTAATAAVLTSAWLTMPAK